MIRKGTEYLLSLAYTIFFKIKWFRYFKLKTKNATNVIWLYQDYPRSRTKYFIGGYWVHDLSLVYSFIKLNQPFAICYGKLPEYTSPKNIFYNISHRFNLKDEADYTKPLIEAVTQLEQTGHTLYPSSAEAAYWENKIYMHQQFAKLKINQPATRFVSDTIPMDENENNYHFPMLVKEAHSCHSQGIYKVQSFGELKDKIETCRKEDVHDFLLQDLVNMRKDMRVIFVGNEIVLHYWRINMKEEWKPTSTSHGSMVDFETFPEQWRNTLLEYFKSLNLTTGAFDVTFEGDDTNTPPIILEVSPAYMPNPVPTGSNKTIPYYEYKKKLFTSNAYYKAMIDIVYDIKCKEVSAALDKMSNRG